MGLVTTSSRWWSLDIVILVALLVIYYDFPSTSSAVVTFWWRRLWLAWSFWAQVKLLGRWLRLPRRSMATCRLLGMGLVTTSRRGWCLDFVVFVAQPVLCYDFATTPSTVVLSWLRRPWL